MLAPPPGGLAPPPRGNPGSTIDYLLTLPLITMKHTARGYHWAELNKCPKSFKLEFKSCCAINLEHIFCMDSQVLAIKSFPGTQKNAI